MISIIQMLFYLVTACYSEHSVVACVIAWTCSCICARAFDKDRRMERAKEKETAREFSADIWVRLTERTAPEAGPSPSAPKMTHDCFDFCHPLSPSAPKPKPPTNTEASIDIHTLTHTQRHTVTHCILLRLHYLYPRDMSPPCWMTFGLVQH